MTTEHKLDSALRYLLAGACIVIITLGLRLAADVVGLVCISVLLALAVLPVPSLMMRKGVPKSLAIALTLVITCVGGLLVLGMLAVSVSGLIETLPTYEGGLRDLRQGAGDLLARFNVDLNKIIPTAVGEPRRIIEIGVTLAQQLLGVLTYSLLMVFVAVFVLIEIVPSAASRKAGSEATESRLKAGFLGQMTDVKKYISITGWIGLMTAGVNLILLLIVGVDFPLTWAFLSFLLNYIPNIGFVLSVIPPAVLALLELGWTSALIVVVGFFLINSVVEAILKPKMMSKGLDVPLIALILGLVYWTWVLGALGAILAVPLTIVVRNMVLLAQRPRAVS